MALYYFSASKYPHPQLHLYVILMHWELIYPLLQSQGKSYTVRQLRIHEYNKTKPTKGCHHGCPLAGRWGIWEAPGDLNGSSSGDLDAGEPSHVLSLPLKHLVVTFSSPHKGLPSTHQTILFSQGHRSTSECVLLERENHSCTAGIRRCCLESMSVCFVFLASEIVPRECESGEFSKRSDTLWCFVPPRATGLNYRKKETKLFSSVNQSHVCSLNSRNLLLHCIAKTLQALKVHIHCWKTSDSLLKKNKKREKAVSDKPHKHFYCCFLFSWQKCSAFPRSWIKKASVALPQRSWRGSTSTMLRTITSSTWKKFPKATVLSGAPASHVPLKTGRMNSERWGGEKEEWNSRFSFCLFHLCPYALIGD